MRKITPDPDSVFASWNLPKFDMAEIQERAVKSYEKDEGTFETELGSVTDVLTEVIAKEVFENLRKQGDAIYGHIPSAQAPIIFHYYFNITAPVVAREVEKLLDGKDCIVKEWCKLFPLKPQQADRQQQEIPEFAPQLDQWFFHQYMSTLCKKVQEKLTKVFTEHLKQCSDLHLEVKPVQAPVKSKSHSSSKEFKELTTVFDVIAFATEINPEIEKRQTEKSDEKNPPTKATGHSWGWGAAAVATVCVVVASIFLKRRFS